MAKHPPAARRAVIRELKAGGHPASLLDAAGAITDPGHAASALLAVAGDVRLPATKAAAAVREATKRLAELDRPGRMAEAWGDVLHLASRIERGPECATALERLRAAGVKVIEDLPQGEWTANAIEAVAGYIDDEQRRRLMRRALTNRGWETAPAKALLVQDESLVDLVREHAPTKVAAHLLALADPGDALGSAWAIEDRVERLEALRLIVWQTEEMHRLGAIAGSTHGKQREDRVAVLTMVAGRIDRLGGDATKHFEAAQQALAKLSGKAAIKAQRKLATTMERAGFTPAGEAIPAPATPAAESTPVEAAPEPPREKASAPVLPGDADATRHTLALVDGYSGGLGAPHIRAVARAAPLCAAFGLDLVLMGFPLDDPEEIVPLVEAETNVGEGEGYVRALYDEGRLDALPLAHGVPPHWPGHPLATTPHPDPEKATRMGDAKTPICLLVGLGKQGLPHRLLNAVEHHHELTGAGISLETATAMGILADRLGRVKIEKP